jgi:hypothetical protein
MTLPETIIENPPSQFPLTNSTEFLGPLHLLAQAGNACSVEELFQRFVHQETQRVNELFQRSLPKLHQSCLFLLASQANLGENKFKQNPNFSCGCHRTLLPAHTSYGQATTPFSPIFGIINL